MTENNRVRRIRNKFNLTMEEFGKRLGVSKVAISNIENGNRGVTNQMRTAIIKEFGINAEWFDNGGDDAAMLLPKSSEEQIADVLAAFTNAPEGSFINRLAKALSRLDDKDWEEIARIVEKMAEK